MESTLTHWKKLTNPDYLGAYSLMNGDEKTELVVTIEKIKREMVAGADGKKEECTIAVLKGQKPMILNKENQKNITKALGTPYIEQWSGKAITIYVKTVKAFGETTDALRVKDTAPKSQLPELNELHDKWQPAIVAISSGKTTIEKLRSHFSISEQSEQALVDAVLNLQEQKQDEAI